MGGPAVIDFDHHALERREVEANADEVEQIIKVAPDAQHHPNRVVGEGRHDRELFWFLLENSGSGLELIRCRHPANPCKLGEIRC
jgi:hypothetical protein